MLLFDETKSVKIFKWIDRVSESDKNDNCHLFEFEMCACQSLDSRNAFE